MPHTPVPAGELNARLSRLRAALAQHDPAWSMTILDNKIDLLLLHRHHAGWRAHRHARPSGAVRPPFIQNVPNANPLCGYPSAEQLLHGCGGVPRHPPTVSGVAARTTTLQKLSMLQKYLPFTQPQPVDGVLAGLRAVKKRL